MTTKETKIDGLEEEEISKNEGNKSSIEVKEQKETIEKNQSTAKAKAIFINHT